MLSTMTVDWDQIKSFVDLRCVSIQWVDLGDRYWLQAFDGPFSLQCFIHKEADTDAAALVDFETNYKSAGNKSFSDIDGTSYIRTKVAKKGWIYSMIMVRVETSTIGSMEAEDRNGVVYPGLSLHFYNANDEEVTDPAYESTIVKTVFNFEPPYDYEIIGGSLSQASSPPTNIDLWVVAVPDIPVEQGGSKEFISCVDLDMVSPSNRIVVDGRVSKLMEYSATYHTNKISTILKHEPGVKHKVAVILEVYRA